MTDDEIEQLISTLEDLLRELNLDPIVAQERVLATEGEVKTGDDLGERAGAMQTERSYQAVALPRYDMAGTPRREAQKRFRFANDDVRVTPLNARARLRNLLDLVEVATAGTLAMERIVHDEVASLLSDGIVFVDPPESELRGVRQKP